MQILYLRSVNATFIVKKGKRYMFQLKPIKLCKEIPLWRINHKVLRGISSLNQLAFMRIFYWTATSFGPKAWKREFLIGGEVCDPDVGLRWIFGVGTESDFWKIIFCTFVWFFFVCWFYMIHAFFFLLMAFLLVHWDLVIGQQGFLILDG